METLKELLGGAREAAGTVIETPARTAPYTYEEFVPNVWKSGNLFGHYGVHPGAEVTVVAGPKAATAAEQSRHIDAADSLLGVLGAMTVGATVRLQPVEPVDSRVLLLPAGWAERYERTPRCTVVAYGGPPEKADVVHFEQEMWSENPIEPPEQVEATDPALAGANGTVSHGDLVAVARELVSESGLDSPSKIVLAGPVTEPGAVVAVVATVAAGATLVVGTDGTGETEADLVVAVDEREKRNTVTIETLTQRLCDTHRA